MNILYLFLLGILFKAIARIIIDPRHGKTGFCICENKDADQLHYTDSTIPLRPKSEIASV